jgi:poly-gamma-glutamate capsule biosynthesis protein CapA/YwtB (metallophosphatase superfamily)
MKLALAGDTMLGRGVAERIVTDGPNSLFAPTLVAALREADLCLLNLECCISERGVPAPGKVFRFRAPAASAQALASLGVNCVTLANNHALDFGPDALLDTFAHLESAGIAWVGAGVDLEHACTPTVLEAGGSRLGVIAVADHPADYAAAPARPGVAYADLGRRDLPDWLPNAIEGLDTDAILVSPHWGPNMLAEPVAHVRAAARFLLEAGATLIAGHSAHVFHGLDRRIFYDLGDFLDDYAVDQKLRNDLGLLFLVDLDGDTVEAIPLKLEFAYTRLADRADFAWVGRRFREACAAFGTEVAEADGRLVARWR